MSSNWSRLFTTMQSNARKSDSGRHRLSSVSPETKQVRQIHTRKVPYRVGYSWNKGGRLKELRIRHLARKFLKIWLHNTFGRILPHEAKSHYKSVVLRQAFEGWRDMWWMSRREWILTMRAECHYRYYLYKSAFKSWQTYMALQREKKSKVQNAQSFAARQRMRLVWNRWEVFTEMRRMKNRMLESALELKRLASLHSAWHLWQTRLQQHQVLCILDEQARIQRALTLQRKTWLQWKEIHTAACCQKEGESKAALHVILRLKTKTLHGWKSYVACRQSKKKSQAVAQHVCHLRLVRMFWNKWSSALHHKQREENRWHAAGHLAVQSTQRKALEHWRAYVTLCRKEYERNRIASQHHHHHLLHAGLQGLSLNITWNKMHRLNHIAVQHYCQAMTSKYWKLWQDRLEEAEDESFQPLRAMAVTKHRISLLTGCFHQWREKLAERRHMQELEHRIDIRFAERMLPLCFNSWVGFTLQRRCHEQRRHKAKIYNQQRQYTWVFYTWWGQAEKRKEQMLLERIAILHEGRCHLQRAFRHWKQRAEQQTNEKERQAVSDHLYLHTLLHKTMSQWKDSSAEIRNGRSQEQQACHQGDLCCMRSAMEKWKQFIQSQRVQKSRLKQIQRYHEVKLLKHTFMVWKAHHLQMCQIYSHADELYRQQEENFLRKVLSVWRENAALLAETRLMERQTQNHFQHTHQLKVFLAWGEATTHAVSMRHQQREAVIRAQRSINQVRLLRSFRRWRKEAGAARTERISMEKASWHHESKLLSKALEEWIKHHNQYHKNKVMKRQGIFLLRLKMYQTYFDQWKVKLQHRQREAEQTEQALWHWSLTLQAKVLYGWRLWVTEQRRQRAQAARAAQVYRDQLLREGVTCILTYAARMSDLTTSLMQHSQEQRSQRLQRVVKNCAMHWKQRALCKPQRQQKVKGQQPKKSVTFCLTTPGSKSVVDSAEHEDEELCKFAQNQAIISGAEAAPGPVLSCLYPATVPATSTRHTHPNISTQEAQDVLLPPSAFMTNMSKDTLAKTSSSCFGDDSQQSSAYSVCVRASSGEILEMDPTSTLIRELLSIQMDMKTYQQDRKQLRGWLKMKEVLESWLQTSGKDDQMEKNAVVQELKELEERIDGLSTELTQRKPEMLLHAERIQHLQTVLTDHAVFTALR